MSLGDEVREVAQWWHSIDLGDGIVTPGRKSLGLLAQEFEALDLGDLTGKTVLDIGAWDGWFSFECERRGAARVVALDTYDKANGYWIDGVVHYKGLWRDGVDLARKTLGSSVEIVSGDFMTMEIGDLGRFDIVLFLGMLYHLRDPLLGLERLAQVTGGEAYIESQVVVLGGHPSISACAFHESTFDNDESNWWSPTQAVLLGMCTAAGFSTVEVLAGPPDEDRPPAPEVHYHRALVRSSIYRDRC